MSFMKKKIKLRVPDLFKKITLIDLMIIIAITGILASIIIPALMDK